MFFGFKTGEKFLAKDTYILKSVEVLESVPTPGITVCNLPGWKEMANFTNTDEMMMQNTVDTFCKDASDIYACIKNGTFSMNDTFKEGAKFNVSLMDPQLWKEDLTVGWTGRCFTFNDTRSLTSNSYPDTLSFEFNSGSHGILVHDPNFFACNMNPLGFPMIFKTVGALTQSPWFRLQMTKHHKMNLDSRPCEEDTEYNFQVKNIILSNCSNFSAGLC